MKHIKLFEAFIAQDYRIKPETGRVQAGDTVKVMGPEGEMEDIVVSIEGNMCRLAKSGLSLQIPSSMTIESYVTEGVEYATMNLDKGIKGRYRLESDEIDVVKALNLSGFKYGKAFGTEVGFESAADRNKFIKILNKMQKDGKLEESTVNEAKKLDREEMMEWLEGHLNFVRTTEEFDGAQGGIWTSGENGDMYKGKRIFDYYNEDYKKYEFGVYKPFAKEMEKRGWYGEWYDAGTMMIWPI